MKKVSSLILSSVLLLLGCDTFDLTQTEAPTIKFEEQKTSIPADGTSRLLVTLNFQRPLSGDQEVSIGVTNGLLSSFPFSGSTESLTPYLTVTPRGESFSFLLIASRLADNEVLLNAGINELVSTRVISFTKVCPDDIIFDLTENEASIGSGSGVNGIIKLFNNTQSVSEGIRIDLMLSNDSLANAPSYIIYSVGTGESFTISPKGRTGKLTITALVNEPGCSILEVSEKLSFIE